MEKFNQAIKAKVRFNNGVSYMTVEQLYDLSLEEVAELGRSIERDIQSQKGTTSYFSTGKEVSPTLMLKLEVVKAVFDDKKADVAKETKRRELTKKLDILQRTREAAVLKAYEKMTAEELAGEEERVASEIANLG